jgi:uncharacterized protein (TIRG00374 family)
VTSLAVRPARGAMSFALSVGRWVLAALAAAVLVRVLVHADLHRVIRLVRGLGAVAPLLVLPAVAVLVLETIAWRISLAPIGPAPGYAHLARVRLATDSLLMSVPGGVVLSEALMPVLLRDQCGLPIAKATAATVARKWLGTRAHALYILLSAALGWGFLSVRSASMVGVPGLLPWLVLLSALLPLGVASFMELATSGGAAAKHTWRLLTRVPITRLRTWVDARRDAFDATDGELARVMNQGRGRAAASTLVYLGAWLCESLEAFVIARALGAHLDFTQVLAFEAGLSLLRSLVFFAPSGIGVQDLGYVALFACADGDGAALGGAFVLVKRARELVWVIAGWLLVAAALRAQAATRSAR